MKAVLGTAFLIILCADVSLSQTQDDTVFTPKGSFTTYELGQSPCFVAEEEKDMYHKCQIVGASIQPYAFSQTCGQDTTIPADKASSCGLDDGQNVLSIHNKLREQRGAAPLVWSKVLSQSAQAVADTCTLGPSGSEYGENMLMSSSELSCSKSSNFWRDEEELWTRLGEDNPDYYPDTGSFTQMVWKNTMQVGCAQRQCDSGNMVVCHYYPPGNVVGGSNFAKNVGFIGEEPPCTATIASSEDIDDATEGKEGDICCTNFLGFIKRCQACGSGRKGLLSSLLS